MREPFQKSMPIVDANVLLRYLLDDDPEMAARSREIILSGVQTTIEVLAEVVYVLRGPYRASRSDIADGLLALLQDVSIPNAPAVRFACRMYGQTNLDFVDCLLAGYHHVNGETVLTYDKKLNKVLGQTQI